MRRRSLLAGIAFVPFAARAATLAGEPVLVGVSGPLTGQYAQYGAQWQRGFDLAVDEVNAAGGIGGRPLALRFRGQPERSAAGGRDRAEIRQRPAHRDGDRRLLLRRFDGGLADLSARQAGAVRFHQLAPRFHQGRRLHVDATRPIRPRTCRISRSSRSSKLGMKKLGLLYINGDWGRTSQDIVHRRGETARRHDRRGGRLPADRAGFSLHAGARARRQARQRGADFVLSRWRADRAGKCGRSASTSRLSPPVRSTRRNSSNLAAPPQTACTPTRTSSPAIRGRPCRTSCNGIARSSARESRTPTWRRGLRRDGAGERRTSRRAEPRVKACTTRSPMLHDVPSVVYGTVKFDVASRRVRQPAIAYLMVKDEKFVAWDGKPAIPAS